MPFYKENLLPPPQTLQQAYQNALTRIQQYGNQWTQYGDTMRGLTGIVDKWSRGQATPEERGYAVSTAVQNMSVPAPIVKDVMRQ